MGTIDYSCSYPGINIEAPCIRFTDKSIQENERELISGYWKEQLELYGVEVKYFVNTYNVLSADNFYGEEPTKIFADPRHLIIGVTLNENAIALSKFGFESDDEVTAFIHISSFYNTFYTLSSVYDTQYNLVEPKAGDVFQLSEYGSTRPGNRQAKYFEITERLDQDVSQINMLQGHYVWHIKAKRLDYSFEPNIQFNSISDNLSGNSQVYDDAFSGILSGGDNEPTQNKKDVYDDYGVDSISEKIFDMTETDNDDIYGEY